MWPKGREPGLAEKPNLNEALAHVLSLGPVIRTPRMIENENFDHPRGSGQDLQMSNFAFQVYATKVALKKQI